MLKNINKQRWTNIGLIISSSGFLWGLIAFAYMGSFMRLIGDDYFLAANFKSFGFWGAQAHAYMNHGYFHGNRFGQTFILTFFSLFPPIISGILPALVIIVLIAAVYFFISTVLAHLDSEFSVLTRLIISLISAFFTLFLVPTINQGLYWRSSMVSSFGTNIGAFILGALILWKKPLKWYWFPLIFIYALFNAGLSENGAAYQGVMAALLLCYGIYLKFKGGKSCLRICSLSLTALLATMIAIVIMWKSPGILVFKRDISNSLIDAINLSFYHVYNFVKEMLLSKTLDIALILLLGFFMFFLVHHAGKARLPKNSGRPINAFILIVIVQALNLLFIFALMLPSAYTRNAYPDPRHFMGAVLAFMFAFLVTGFYSGAFVQVCFGKSKILSTNAFFMVSLAAFLIISLVYPMTAIPRITAERLKFKYWATQWDQRHDLIVQAAKAGEQQIHVLQMDHIIENVSELGPDPTSPTYNEPASIYYGITIIADQPGWDEGFIEFRDQHKSRR